MNKKRTLRTRFLSLILSFVLVARMFAGMGLEVNAAEKKIVLYKATSGIIFTDGSWIDRDINMRIYDSNNKYEHVSWKAGSGATTTFDEIKRIEFTNAEGIDATQYYIHPNYNTHMQHSIIVWTAGKLNITVVDHENKPVANQVVRVKWNGTDYGTVTTDSQGKATHWGVRHIASNVTVSTNYDGRTHTATTGYLGDSYDIMLKIPQYRTVSVNLKNANDELLKNATVKSGSITFSDSDNNGTYTADLEVGKSYDISAYVNGYDAKTMSSGTITENTSSINMILDASVPSVWPITDSISIPVGGTQTIDRFTMTGLDGQGITYTSEIENPTIASYDGSKVTGLKVGTTNLHFHAVTGSVKRTRTIPVTVNKINPTVTVTLPSSLIYGEYGGDVTFRSSAAGTFSANGKRITVTADSDVKKKVTEIIDGNPEIGFYNLAWTFTPTDEEKYNAKSDITIYTVGVKDIANGGSLTFAAPDAVYDGTEKKVTNLKVTVGAKELTENADYTVSYVNNVNAGQATVTVTGKGNYTGTITKTFHITKATLSVITASAASRQYDGTTTVKITGVGLKNKAAKDAITDIVDLSNVTAEISGKNVGTYDYVSGITGIVLKDTNNYIYDESKNKTAISLENPSVTISPKQVTIENVSIEPEKIYDGNTTAKITNEGTLSANYDGANLSIVKGYAHYNNENVGSKKTVTFDGFSLDGSAKANYSLTKQPKSMTAHIIPKILNLDPQSLEIKWKYYDGTKNAEFAGVPTLIYGDIVGADMVELADNVKPVFDEIGSPDEEREIDVTTNLVLVGEDASNYTLQIPKVTGIIKNFAAEKNRDYVVNTNDWTNQDFVIKAADGCVISDNLESPWVTELTVTCEDNQSNVGDKTFYVRYEDGVISKNVKEHYKIDKIAPTGTVTFTDVQDPWNSFADLVTFDDFYNEEQEVVITAQDQGGLSGIASIKWYESLEGGLSREEVERITDWKTYEGNVIVSLEDTKKFVYYVKIEDHAGNVTYISTDGAVYDTTKPAVTGIADGENYYVTQNVNIEDTNLKEVTLNDSPVEVKDGLVDTITLPGNVDTTYTLFATDKAGNEIIVTVTMKTIESIGNPIKDLKEDNVTGDEDEAVKTVEDILSNLDTEDATEEEKNALKELQEETEGLRKVIEETKEDVKGLKDNLAKYDKDSITSSQEEAIDQLIRDIETTQKDENLSKEQKLELEKALEDAKDLAETIDKAKEALENAQNATKDINTENVALENQVVLEETKKALDDIVSSENGNYTKEEKEAAQNELTKINDLLEIVYHVNEVNDKNNIVNQLIESVKDKSNLSGHKDIVEKAVEVKQAYELLTEKEKSLVGETNANQIMNHYEKAVAFAIIKGADGIYTKDSKSGLSFTANGDFDLFKVVKVDGVVVDAKNYTAKAGSTVVKLKASYLDTLENGKHTFMVGYEVLGEEYNADCNFTVEEEQTVTGTNSPDTGDTSNVFGWICAMVASAMLLFVAAKRRRED